jgi:polyphosphate kinase 2 (PPK2 family)
MNQRLPGIKKTEDVTSSFWINRYRQINDIERHLTENGTIVLKFFLNVSKDEQKKRFLKRIEDPSRNWKFSAADIKERQHWDAYMQAYSDMLTHTSTEVAPWYVIPADHKWFMRYAVSNIIINRLKTIDLQFPTLPKPEQKRLAEAQKELDQEA